MNNKKFIITIIILAVIVAAVSFFAVNEARKNKEMSQALCGGKTRNGK